MAGTKELRGQPLEGGHIPRHVCPSFATHHSHRRAGQGGGQASELWGSHTAGSSVAPRRDQAMAGVARAWVQERWCAGSISCLCTCSSRCVTLTLISARHRWRLGICQADCMYHTFLNSFKHHFQACARASMPYFQLFLCHPRWVAQGLSAGVWRQRIFKEISMSRYCFSPFLAWCQTGKNAKIKIKELCL